MRAVPDGDPVPSPAAEAVAAIRHELRSLLGEADAVGPLPTPAFVAPGDERSDLRGRHTTDLMPGARKIAPKVTVNGHTVADALAWRAEKHGGES